ncbi:MAG TPA: winged helix-turn-helix domain-containing protein [Pirellulales bacterium]|nr:winged helix-turn-helix domain-containing protein [Pirellulales bacterium]
MSTTLICGTPSRTVLVIDGDSPARRLTCTSLIQEGYRLIEAASGSEAIALAAARPPDLVLVDIDQVGSTQLLGEFRACLAAPLIVISASSDDASKIAAFDAGADDYLTKPIAIAELLARLRVAIRHALHRAPPDNPLVTIGDLRVNRASRQAFIGQREIKLTPIEGRLLDVLAANVDRPLTHEFLLRQVWGPESIEDVQYLRVFVAGLRRKIEPNPHRPRYIVTEQGVGYRLSSNHRLALGSADGQWYARV